ncbi:MAG: 1-deoxy-D-xylulose-5-phosphate reductoisomerase [bacterium]|nr:1-deoxy-D-xylulose-5-phosphate reductoisomerase [bacterium]
MSVKHISILGSTGSIGRQTLDVLEMFPDKFSVVALSAGRNIDLLKNQIIKFKPRLVSVMSKADADKVEDFIAKNNLYTDVYSGDEGLIKVAADNENDILIVAVVGFASLVPTYTAIEKGITIGLACKEILVAAGKIIMDLANKKKVPVLPVDSEHAALKQCLAGVGEDLNQVRELVLTASGGPFWQMKKEDFVHITREDALKHPNWDMGAKITIDSATMMNKGLEVIEAHHLFGAPFENIKVLIHPQSIVHSMAVFLDGTVLAQMGMPDMRFPIQYVLTYPDKLQNNWPKMNLAESGSLEFYDPDLSKFPLLQLACEAGEKGGSWPVVLNAANDVAVGLFLDNKISFTDIELYIRDALGKFSHFSDPDLEQIIDIDNSIKKMAFSSGK